jgi:signal transduction histidine kinase
MIRRPHPSVRLRLTLTYTVLFVVTGTALLAVSYLLVQHREKGPATAVQVICGRTVNGQTVTRISGSASSAGSGTLTVSPTQCPLLVGSVYYRSFSAGPNGSQSGKAVSQALPAPVSPATQAEFRSLTAAVSASQSHTLDSFKLESGVALGIITILSFGLSWWVAGRALAPVHRITDAARRLSERTLHDRINLHGPNDELKQLADTFDAMLGRLERAFISQRRFVANASHELRTPLAIERVLIDEALANRTAGPDDLRTILEQLRANSEDTERLIDALLLLARSERGIEEWCPVDLTSVVASVLDQSAPEAADAGVTLSSHLEPAVVRGDPGLLERLAGNLVENAIRHNATCGAAVVSVSSCAESHDAVLEVENSGPPLDPESIDGLVEPFRRAGPDRATSDGVGLGLSIVNAVVTAHHGTLALRARQGGGLHVRVRLPVARLSAASPEASHVPPRKQLQSVPSGGRQPGSIPQWLEGSSEPQPD